MKIIKLIKENFNSVKEEALSILKSGRVVVTPSETQYGLSADPSNEMATRKLYDIKKQNYNKPLGLVAGSKQIIKKNFIINSSELKIIDKFWPGPIGLLLVLKEDDIIQRIAKLTLGDQFHNNQPDQNKIIIRVTSNKFLSELSKILNLPLISTSANISGQSECFDIECVRQQFKDNEVLPDLIIDAGVLEPKPASTMLDLTGDKPVVIREGANFDDVKKFLNTLKV